MADTVGAQPARTSGQKKKIHHIWIGSRVAQKELDYADVWAATNAARTSSDHTTSTPYQRTLWVDPNALLVNDVKKEVLLWAEWQALKEMGIHDVATFDRKMADFVTRQKFLSAKFRWASRKRYELARDLADLPSSNLNDGERAVAIFAMRAERLSRPVRTNERQALLEQLASDRMVITQSIRRGEFKDINVVLNLPEHTLMRRAYQQELNLRQNLAAAADIARMLVLKHEGGVYADLDLLPQFKDEAFITIAKQLERAGYVMPTNVGKKWSALDLTDHIPDWRNIPERLMAAVTDAVVSRLGLIDGYTPTKAYEIDPKLLADDPARRADIQARQAAILKRVVNQVITARYPGRYDVFQPLGDVRSPMGFELGCYRALSEGEVVIKVNNQFIISTDPTFVDRLYEAVAQNYRFILDPRVAHYLRPSSTGYGSKAMWEELKLLWSTLKGTGTVLEFDATISYMADGILPGAVSTVVISGPEVYRKVAEKMLERFASDDYDVLEASLFESQVFNAETSDGADSSWMTRRQSMGDLRARQFPDAAPVATLADSAESTWTTPSLATTSTQDPADSFNFHHQLIVQIDGDDVSRGAAQALFNKHAAHSMFAQLHGDQLQFFFATQADQRTYERFGPGQFMQGDGPVRLTLVGHGRRRHGVTTFGARTPQSLMADLAQILREGGYAPTKKLVINLVGCYLDDSVAGNRLAFAQQFAQVLPDFLAHAGIGPEWVDIHARAGVLTVDESGRKSTRHSAYVYREGEYVREGKLVEVPDEAVPAQLVHASGTDRPIDLRRIGLVSPDGKESDGPQAYRHIVMTWGSRPQSTAAAAGIFNHNAHDHILLTLEGAVATADNLPQSARTVYYDAGANALMVRHGLSVLTGHAEDVRLSIVGVGAGTIDAPTLNGATSEQLSRLLHAAVKHLMTDAYGAAPARRLTVTLEGTGSDDSLLVAASNLGQTLGAELLKTFTDLGVDPKRVDIVAREGRMQRDPQGNRVCVTSNGMLITGDLADVYSTLSASTFHFNSASGVYERAALRADELAQLSGKLLALHGQRDLSPLQRDQLARATLIYLKVLRHASEALPTSPLHRAAREAVIAQIHEALDLRHARLDALSRVQGPSGSGWKHVPEMVERDTHGGYKLGFVSPDEAGRYLAEGDQVRWVHVEDDVFMRWAEKTKALGAILAAGITRTGNTLHAEDYAFTDATEAGAAHTISAAFLLQALIGPERGLLSADDSVAMAALAGRRVEDLTADEKRLLAQKLPYIRAQLASNYAQLTAGLVGDVAELTRAINVLRAKTPGLSAGLAKAGLAVSAVGAAFDIANVVFASIDLANAHTTSEKTEAGVRLGTSVVNAGMSIGSVSGAGIARWLAGAAEGGEWAGVAAGAGAVAETLGVLAVPVTGLGIGLVEVIKAFDHTAEGVDATLHALMRAAQGAQPAAIIQEGRVLRFSDSLVASSLDLSTGVLTYGRVRMRGLKPYNRLVAPSPSSEMLDLYQPFLDKQNRRVLSQGALESTVIVLPSARSRDYEYTLVASPGKRFSHDFPLLETLEKAYPGKFYWWTYRQTTGLFGWDYSPSDLRTTYQSTPFSLKLDDNDRTIVIPSIEASDHRDQLRYTLQGGHGHYTVVLPAWPSALHIADDATHQGRWQLDLTHAIYPEKIIDGRRVRGEMSAQQLGHIAILPTGVTIEGREWVSFDGGIPKDLTLFVGLDDSGGSKLVMRRLSGIVGLEEDTASGQMETWLQSDTQTGLNQGEVQRLAQLLVKGGVAHRHIRLSMLDGSTGVLDLATRHWALITFDASSQTSTLYLDAQPVLTLAATSALQLGYDRHDEQGGLIVAWSAAGGMRVDMTYRDARLVHAHVHAPEVDSLCDVSGADEGPLVALGPWLRQLPVGQLVSVDNAAMERLGLVTLGPGAMAAEMVSYASRPGPVSLEIDCLRQRAIVHVAAGQAFSADALDAYRDLLANVKSVEIWIDEALSVLRTSLDLTAMATKLPGKRIDLITQGPVDLALQGSDVAWDTNEGDLVLQVDEHPPIRWIGVTPSGASGHTLALNAQPPRPLFEALEGRAFHDFRLHLPGGDADGTGDRQMMAWLDAHTREHLEQAHSASDATFQYYVGRRRPNGSQLVLDDDMDLLFSMKKSWNQPGFIEIFHRNVLLASVREDADPGFSLDANHGDPLVILALRSSTGASFNYRFRQDDLADVTIFSPHRLLDDISDLLAQAVATLSETPINRPIRLFDSDGNRATATSVNATPVLTSYLGADHEVSLAYDSHTKHLAVRSTAGKAFNLAQLRALSVSSLDIADIDISLKSEDGQPRAVRIDFADSLLAGKRISVEADCRIDLDVQGGQTSVRAAGDDLVFYRGEIAVMTWHEARATGAPAHTLVLAGAPARPLRDGWTQPDDSAQPLHWENAARRMSDALCSLSAAPSVSDGVGAHQTHAASRAPALSVFH